MVKKTIRHKTGAVEYTIYTIEEAKKAGIKYTSWKEAKKGEYSVTDDGYVAICCNKYVYKRGNYSVVAIRYPFGSYTYNEKNGKPGKNVKVLFNRPPKKRSGSIIRKKEKIDVFAIVYLATCDEAEAYKFIYPRSTTYKARYWGRQCLLNQPIAEAIEKQLSMLLERHGINKSNIPELWKEALKMARKTKNVNAFVRIVEDLTKAHYPQEKVRTSLRIIRKSKQKGGIVDIIREEDAKLEKLGEIKNDNYLLPEVQEVKSDDASTVTKQTTDMSIMQERDTTFDEDKNIGHDPADKEH